MSPKTDFWNRLRCARRSELWSINRLPFQVLTSADSAIFQIPIFKHETPPHDCVDNRAAQRPSFVDRVASTRNNRLPMHRPLALQFDNGNIRIEPEGNASLPPAQTHDACRLLTEQRGDLMKRQPAFVVALA